MLHALIVPSWHVRPQEGQERNPEGKHPTRPPPSPSPWPPAPRGPRQNLWPHRPSGPPPPPVAGSGVLPPKAPRLSLCHSGAVGDLKDTANLRNIQCHVVMTLNTSTIMENTDPKCDLGWFPLPCLLLPPATRLKAGTLNMSAPIFLTLVFRKFRLPIHPILR